MKKLKYATHAAFSAVAVHFLNLKGDEPIISKSQADLSVATVDYLRAHLLKALNCSEVYYALPFNEIGPVHLAAKAILDGPSVHPEESQEDVNNTLVEHSAAMAEFMFKMAKQYPRCADFDMVVADVVIDDTRAVAIICLDHLPAIRHSIVRDVLNEEEVTTSLQEAYVLPTVKQRASKVGIFYYDYADKDDDDDDSDEEPAQVLRAMAVEIPFKDAVGDNVLFFAREVMQCSRLWDDESLTSFIIKKAEVLTQAVTRSSLRAGISMRWDLRHLFIQGGTITPKEVLEIIYDSQEDLDKATDNFEAAYGIDVEHKIMLDMDVVKERLNKQQWKTSTGFTIVGSPDAFLDPNMFEVRYNEDGTADLIIKKVYNITAKA